MTKTELAELLKGKTILNIMWADNTWIDHPLGENDLIIEAIEFTDDTTVWLESTDSRERVKIEFESAYSRFGIEEDFIEGEVTKDTE